MTFRDALEREIAAQGLSVAEIARISGVSKGAIYNILNGKTEEDRIRPSTRRAIARGCNRDLEVLEDGGVRFVAPGAPDGMQGPEEAQEVALRLAPGRPFLEAAYLKAAFDWLHELESGGALSGPRTVDRVFQKRSEFLSVVVENGGDEPVQEVRFEVRVSFDGGEGSQTFSAGVHTPVPAGGQVEETLFPSAGPPYSLELMNPVYVDSEGRARAIGSAPKYLHKG